MHRVTLDVEHRDGAARAGIATTARGSYRTPCFMPVWTRGAVKYLGGLGRFSGWDGLTLTDSGGFQVFSLEPKVDDDGVTFRSTYDGSSHRFTPESAVATQELLGADIQMVLDVCPPLPSPPSVVELAF